MRTNRYNRVMVMAGSWKPRFLAPNKDENFIQLRSTARIGSMRMQPGILTLRESKTCRIGVRLNTLSGRMQLDEHDMCHHLLGRLRLTPDRC
nr:hypothetical protein CFP56_09534 [Quercus suber]